MLRFTCDDATEEVVVQRRGEIVEDPASFELRAGDELVVSTAVPAAQEGMIEVRLGGDAPIWGALHDAEQVVVTSQNDDPLIVPIDASLLALVDRCRGDAGTVQGAAIDSASEVAAGGTGVHYTRLQLSSCESLGAPASGGEGRQLRCDGHAGTDLYVTEVDGRHDVDVGVRDRQFSSPTERNTIGDTVEWWISGDAPVAAIVRFNMQDEPKGAVRSELAVLSVGSDDAPGCLVAWVPADASPNQNAAARRVASEKAAAFDCPSTEGSP